MKAVVSLFLSTIIFSSCSYYVEKEIDSVPDSAGYSLITKSNECYVLSEDDILQYTRLLSLTKKTNRTSVMSITPVEIKGKVLFYVVNYNKGWQLISSDRRGPSIIAESPDGYFDYETINEAEKTWLDCIGEQIISRFNSPSEHYSTVTEDVIEKERINISLWDAMLENRNNDITYIQVDTLDYDSQDHLIDLCWHQNFPFNDYCPLTDFNSTSRCPAGCVAVAAAQTLYYLHYNIGRPVYSPSTGYCTGWYQNYTQSFSGYASTWDDMYELIDPYGYAALLIGEVGKMVDMEYAPTISSAYTSDLVSQVFGQYGINCSYVLFDSDIVFNELQAGLPVIGRATEQPQTNASGHTFIIDGYESEQIRYIIHYSDGGQSTSYSLPYMTRIRINWGLGAYGRYTTYATNGTWDGYEYNRKMIHGFCTENK